MNYAKRANELLSAQPQVITSPNLNGISHGFFTRKGGVSEGVYASLNCGLGSGDSKAHVIENRERVARALGGTETKLLSLHQVHSCDVVTVTAPWRHAKKPKADAMVTTQRGIALSILTADCVPVLFADKEHSVIGAAHAGWKGALAGILEKTVEAMGTLGAKPGSISAAIGPCIAQASYEIGDELREQFIKGNPQFAGHFIPAQREQHFLFDLRAAVRDILGKAGITDINTLENDTYIEEDSFFSFRRATHRKEPDYGRQISAIIL